MTGVATSIELKWIEQNATKYGFTPLLNDTETAKIEGNYYKETWHWNYSVGK